MINKKRKINQGFCKQINCKQKDRKKYNTKKKSARKKYNIKLTKKREKMQNKLNSIFLKYEINLSPQQANQLTQFYALVVEKNKIMNLTTITDEDEFIVKHILDSGLGVKFLQDNATVLDIGSGAGFPGIVLKILNPTLKITLLDSVRKKVDFLNEVIQKLNLKNIIAIHARVEDFAKENYESFDYVTSRAVAYLSTLLEYSLPFLKINGKMIAYKGPLIEEELNNAQNSLKILCGKAENIIKLNIEGNDRTFLIVTKTKSCSRAYPRAKNLPRVKPLN